MSEKDVRDAKAKRDSAQADLDKAVEGTKDEIKKAAGAVKEAAPEKALEVREPAGKPVAKPEPPKLPVATPARGISSTVWVVVALVAAAAAVAHFGFKVF